MCKMGEPRKDNDQPGSGGTRANKQGVATRTTLETRARRV